MSISLWWEWARAVRVDEQVRANRIASGEDRFPREWAELLTGNVVERTQWQNDEFQKGL